MASSSAAATMPSVENALPLQTFSYRSTYLCHAFSTSASFAAASSSSSSASSATSSDHLSALHWRVMITSVEPQHRVTIAAQCESPLEAAARVRAGNRPLSAEDEVAVWAAFDSFVLMWSAEVLFADILCNGYCLVFSYF
jgi:hypothetical protein